VDLTSRQAPAFRSPNAAPERRLLVWATSAAVAGFVLGYEVAVISGALLFIRRDFGLSDFEQGALVSMLPLGAMVGGLLAGRLADGLGRRRTLLLDAAVLIAGIVLAVVAPTYGVLLVGRAIVGLGIGAASSTVPLYLSEIAPAGVRGRLVTTSQLMVTSGVLAAYGVDFAFAGSDSWRAMLGIGLLPAAALAIGMLRSPETPAWLEAHGRSDEAREVILQVADEESADRMLRDQRRSREEQTRQRGVRWLLRSHARPALIIGVTLAAAQQFAGINAIISYAPSIMERTGLSVSNSILYSVGIGAINVVATVVSLRLVDRIGRRPLLFVSLGGMFVSPCCSACSSCCRTARRSAGRRSSAWSSMSPRSRSALAPSSGC
jgi:sugar porter (SP) family MFS transporter